MDQNIIKTLATLLQSHKLMFGTAESCTGGKLAAYCTDMPGASNWFDCALVTYTYEAKKQLLGVKQATLTNEGAVSEACVLEMLHGLLTKTHANVGIAISGIAGPDGGTTDKPVGTVWFAIGAAGKVAQTYLKVFNGDRAAIREAACEFAAQTTIHYLTALLQ